VIDDNGQSLISSSATTLQMSNIPFQSPKLCFSIAIKSCNQTYSERKEEKCLNFQTSEFSQDFKAEKGNPGYEDKMVHLPSIKSPKRIARHFSQ